MPIKAERELVCSECGKTFRVVMNDAIMPEDAQMLEKPVCRKCRIKNKLFK